VAAAAAAAGGIDTGGNASSEGRVEGLVGVSDGRLLYYTSLGLGGGYYVSDVGYFLVHNELGIGIDGDDVRPTFGITYTARVHDGVFSAFGGAASVYFRLTEDEETEGSHWAIGPRLSVTGFEDFQSQWVAQFQLSVVIQLVGFRTTHLTLH
jgi:hypothetical protein